MPRRAPSVRVVVPALFIVILAVAGCGRDSSGGGGDRQGGWLGGGQRRTAPVTGGPAAGRQAPGPAPDIAVEEVRILPERPVAGEPFRYCVVVRNVSAAPLEATSGAIVYEVDGRDSKAHFTWHPIPLRLPPLDPGARYSVACDLVATPHEVGRYTLRVTSLSLQGRYANQETNLGDNTGRVDFAIEKGQGGFDLVAESIGVRPAKPAPGSRAMISLHLVNRGPARTPAVECFGLLFGPDGKWIGERKMHFRSGLLPEWRRTIFWALPRLRAGVHKVTFAVNLERRREERNADNNTCARTFTVATGGEILPIPDIAVRGVRASVPGRLSKRSLADFEVVLENRGRCALERTSVNVNYRYRAVASETWFDSCGFSSALPRCGAGEKVTVLVMPIPPITAPGAHTVEIRSVALQDEWEGLEENTADNEGRWEISVPSP